MIMTPDATFIGGTNMPGISVPGQLIIGDKNKPIKPANYIFIQNDSYTNPASAWYVAKVDDDHYEMSKATSPKGSMYVGAFEYDTASDKLVSRLDARAAWTTSDPAVVKINSVTGSGQAVISIVKSGNATLSVTWGGMSSTLRITSA